MNPSDAAKAATPDWMQFIRNFDGLEIMPCRFEMFEGETTNHIERCEPEEAGFWTVYGHCIKGGVQAFEDFGTKSEAEIFAQKLLNIWPHLGQLRLWHPYGEQD